MGFSVYEYRPLLIYCVALAAALGAAMGSFLNCAAWRVVHGEAWHKGRSRCPECGHALGALDLVPVLSWLLLRGKCRYCGHRVSARYVLTELFFAALTVACLLRFDLTALCARNWAFLCCLFCLSLVDWDSCTIPDGCLIVSALSWFAALPLLWGGWRDAGSYVLAGLVFGGGLLLLSLAMDKLLGRESLGGGDIKLVAVAGLYLGFVPTLFALLLSCLLGLIPMALRRGSDRSFPFGPAIAAAAALMLFFGDALTQWYLSLF